MHEFFKDDQNCTRDECRQVFSKLHEKPYYNTCMLTDAVKRLFSFVSIFFQIKVCKKSSKLKIYIANICHHVDFPDLFPDFSSFALQKLHCLWLIRMKNFFHVVHIMYVTTAGCDDFPIKQQSIFLSNSFAGHPYSFPSWVFFYRPLEDSERLPVRTHRVTSPQTEKTENDETEGVSVFVLVLCNSRHLGYFSKHNKIHYMYLVG